MMRLLTFSAVLHCKVSALNSLDSIGTTSVTSTNLNNSSTLNNSNSLNNTLNEFLKKFNGSQEIPGFSKRYEYEFKRNKDNCSVIDTEWRKYACPFWIRPEKFQSKCTPLRILPVNNKLPVKGLIVLYHGYTACPDSFLDLALELSQLQYKVLLPLLPGQGLNKGYGCYVEGACTENYNPNEIPTTKEQYIDWSEKFLKVASAELAQIDGKSTRSKNFTVAAVGLSLGGALALHASELKNTIFTKTILINPYLASSAPSLDFNVKKCLEKGPELSQDCIEKLLIANTNVKDAVFDLDMNTPIAKLISMSTNITKGETVWSVLHSATRILSDSYPSFLSSFWSLLSSVIETPRFLENQVFDGVYGWGPQCKKNFYRGGICASRYRNVAALQSFVGHVVGNIDDIPKSLVLANINSDLDGGVRDSVNHAVLKAFEQNGGTFARCRFQYTCTTEQVLQSISNENNVCGAPHSCLSRAEAFIKTPNVAYWEKSLFTSIIEFIDSGPTRNPKIGVDRSELASDADQRQFCLSTTEMMKFGGGMDSVGRNYVISSKRRYSKFKITNTNWV